MSNYLKIFLAVNLVFLGGCSNENKSNKDEFSKATAINKNSKTNFVISLNQDIDVTKNQFYCSSIGYAWNEVRKHFNNNIQIDNSFKDLKLLNSDYSFQNSLADTVIQTNVSIKGNVTRINAKFNLALPFVYQNYKRFDIHEFLTDDFIETLSQQERSDLLEKKHATFNNETIVTFGPNSEDIEYDALKSVDLLHYKNNNEFAIRMKPADKDHEIILFMPEQSNFKTMRQILHAFKAKEKEFLVKKKTFDSISNNIANDSSLGLEEELRKIKLNRTEVSKLFLIDGDDFSIPILSFQAKKSFKSLEGNIFNGSEIIKEYQQLISFELNEKGAEIESETRVMKVSVGGYLYPPKKLYFNNPFLIIFKRKDSNNPYLVGWIANTDVMEKTMFKTAEIRIDTI
ncbi:hypothetical protein [Tenacibaculum insulae]|uniref:hypothetical protein n=1 Tax=Tenacibaculum insulae TaxID=2029677 RepID=UPI003AB1361E